MKKISYKIELEGKEIVVGAKGYGHLEIRLIHSKEFNPPILLGEALIFQGNELVESQEWEINNLKSGQKLLITIQGDEKPSNPTKKNFSKKYKRKRSKAQKLKLLEFKEEIKEQIKSLKEKSYRDFDASEFCAFCGKNKQDLQIIIEGIKANICDECVKLSMEVIKRKKLN